MTHPKLSAIQQYIADAEAAQTDSAEIFEVVLGKQGMLRSVLESIKELPEAERREVGTAAHDLRQSLQQRLNKPGKNIASVQEKIDWSLPALPATHVGLHPISAMIAEMVDIFSELSFEVVEGQEIVTTTENFDSLNIGKDHPARDGHDSFYLDANRVLRTQTTAVQVLEMQRRFRDKQLPIRVVVPGKTYRRESDQTHSTMFHQIDAVVVDTQTTFADLKGSLDYFAKRLFGESVETRFRPHYFPFTEPSAEIDIKLKHVEGSGRHTGWLEFGGCGMIHPDVLKRAGINPKIYRGWAFGMSVERPVMLRHHVPDLRMLFNNDTRFLSQFNTIA